MKSRSRSSWWWVPSLYFTEGIPYIVVMIISTYMYKNLGISNSKIAFYTAWFYLPWVIKPLWSPLVEILRTRRFWIITMQLVIGAGLGSMALVIPLPGYFKISLIFFWLLAFSSATHDIAIDGFYILGQSQHDQAYFVGIRSTFYRLAMIFGQGILIMLTGLIESHSGLGEVNINVYAVAPVTQEISLEAQQSNQSGLVIEPEVLKIKIISLTKTQADSILTEVKEWNISQGQKNEETDLIASKTTWWQRQVADPLKQFLKARFAETSVPTYQAVGNIGIIQLRLRTRPTSDKDIMVHFGRSSGDKSISLVEGMSFTFNQENWNQSVRAAIQLDPKLTTATAATFIARSGNSKLAWSITFLILGGLFVVFFIYHKLILPFPEADISRGNTRFAQFLSDFFTTFVSFFKKKSIGVSILFLLLFRLGESQLVKLAAPFLLDSQEAGGIGLTLGQIALVYGTIGTVFLMVGGILGGIVVARQGLRKWLIWMVIAINLPDAFYIYLSQVQPENILFVNICVAIEQFGYGFGFTAYMLYMIIVAEGEHKTAHFAICTAFMALGMMIPGMFSGWLQEIIGYRNFFIWVILATIPGFLLIKFLPIPKDFGIKK